MNKTNNAKEPKMTTAAMNRRLLAVEADARSLFDDHVAAARTGTAAEYRATREAWSEKHSEATRIANAIGSRKRG